MRYIQLFLIVFLTFIFVNRLSARKPILVTSVGYYPNIMEGQKDDMSAGKMCDLMLLQRKQRKMCRRDKGVADTLLEAIRLSTQECEYQFKTERWNCSLHGQYRLNILKKGKPSVN